MKLKPTEAWAHVDEDGVIGTDGTSLSVYLDKFEGETAVVIVDAETWAEAEAALESVKGGK